MITSKGIVYGAKTLVDDDIFLVNNKNNNLQFL